jgi:hypothetical protein
LTEGPLFGLKFDSADVYPLILCRR